MTNRSAATPLPAALRRVLDDPSLTVGFYDRRSCRFDVEPASHLIGRAAGAAHALIEGGVTPGRPVLVAGAGPDQLWSGYLAAALAGGVPLVLPVRPALDRAADVARRLAAARRQVPDGVLAVATTGGEPVIEPGPGPWLPLAPPGPGSAPDGAAHALLDRLERLDIPPAAPLHLQLTSGSTGEPRPVVITGGNAEANVGAFARALGLTPDSHLVCWLPLYHDLALVGSALTSLLAHCHLRLLSPFDFLADPTHWLTAVGQSPRAVSAGPNFALDQVVRRFDPARHPELDLSGWDTCLTGAEPIDMATVARFRRALEPLGLRPEAIRPGYGLAEATLVVSLASRTGPRSQTVEDGTLGRVEAACLGPVIDDVTIEIVGSDGATPLDEGCSGEVIVTGPAVSPGYRRPDGTIEPFPGGRCATGDLGLVLDGELYLVDRLKSVVIRHGRNWSAAALEAELAHGAAVPVDRCAVVQSAFDGDRVSAVVERGRRGDDGELLAALRRSAADLEVGIDEIVLVRRGGLPRTTSGKKRHVELRTALRSGRLEVVAREVLRGRPRDPGVVVDLTGPEAALSADPSSDLPPDLLTAVTALVVSHARRLGWSGGPVGEHTALRALGFDSLAVVELTAEMHAVLGVSVSEDALGTAATVGDLVRAGETGPGAAAHGTLLARFGAELPQLLRRVDAQRGRQLLIDGRWVTDLAGVNYLGLDLDPVVQGAVGPMVERWGAHPSWTRIVASPAPYRDLETGLAQLTGAPDTLVFPTVTLTHLGVLPLLAGRGDTLVVDRWAHRSVQEAAELAAARGAELRRFEHTDTASLARALDGARGRLVVALNGVYSMTGTVPDLAAVVELVAAAGGVAYVDDAHGLGVLGRRPPGVSGRPDEPCPYGSGGGGVVAHLGLDYDHIVYVAGLSKAFSSMAAFVTCRHQADRTLFEQASTAVFSGPVPVASLATALAGLAVNAERGDELRRHLHRLTIRAIDGARERGWAVDNTLAFPIVNLVTGGVERTIAACKVMWDHGILFTPSVFPAAPLDRGGFRISFTAANTDDDVDRLLAALDAVAAAVGQPPGSQLLSPA